MAPNLARFPQLLCIICLACALAPGSAQTPGSTQTLLRFIRESTEHDVFARLLSLRSLDERLGRFNEKFTVFAPTDDAFYKLVTGLSGQAPANADEAVAFLETVRPLLEGKNPSLADIVAYHITSDGMTIGELQMISPFRTLAARGYQLSVSSVNSTITVEDGAQDNPVAKVTQPDGAYTNGYLQVISEVLLPVNAATIVDLIKSPTPTPSASMSPSESESMMVTPSASPTMSASPSDNSSAPSLTPSLMPSLTPPSGSASADPSADPSAGTSASGAGSGAGSGAEDGGGDGSDEETETDATAESTSSAVEDGENDSPVCFPASARVSVSDGGVVRMSELTSSHRVRYSATDSDADAHSAVFLFTHRDARARSRMVRVVTACGHAIVLSPQHYLRGVDGGLIAAAAVRVGVDSVRTVSGDCKVTATERVTATGLYAPHSLHGDIVVDGVVASSYSAAVYPKVAHALLAPVRWAVRHGLATEPFGATFNYGADRVAKWMPKGGDRVRGM